MQNVMTGREEYAVREEAEVPFGTRVSWQAAWAGTITTFSVATILWLLALAIIALTMTPTAASLRGATLTAWICMICTIVVGNFFGGMVAARVRGSLLKSVGALHGFITWALSFVLAVIFSTFLLRTLLLGAINALPDVLSAEPGAPVAADAAAAGRTAIDYLIGFGWTWFGTAFVAMLFSVLGAIIGVRRARGREPEPKLEREESIPPVGPLTPAPTA